MCFIMGFGEKKVGESLILRQLRWRFTLGGARSNYGLKFDALTHMDNGYQTVSYYL